MKLSDRYNEKLSHNLSIIELVDWYSKMAHVTHFFQMKHLSNIVCFQQVHLIVFIFFADFALHGFAG